MLEEKIFELDSFKSQYEAILILSVCRTIKELEWDFKEEELLNSIDWNNILGIASILAYSDQLNHLDASLRISQTALSEKSTNLKQKEAAAVILLSLTNKPAISLAINRKLIENDFEKNLPFTFKLQNNKIAFENSIIIGNELLELNRFQREVYQIQQENDVVSISAPTSAGKSFILCNILILKLLEEKKNIVYIVPTRALISQVENDLKEYLKKYNLNNVDVFTVPQDSFDSNSSNILVFTQERLHWFFCENSMFKIDILVIDEAQKIEDSNRGILLQQKIEEVVRKNPEVKVYFSSPFTSNPEILLDNIKKDCNKDKVNTQFVAVNQNLLYATQVPRDVKKWNISLCLVDKVINLGKIKTIDRPSTEFKKMSFIVNSFSYYESGIIIYSNGAADSEKLSNILYESLQEETITDELAELIKLVEKTIHEKYVLCKVLKKRIAFHYGNMPLIIREEIERLFKEGEIKYLICTSTLLEGVNLPAKSIFIRKPRRGKGKPLNENDFWNLAGRAGRWGKEFNGNIICIEPNNWEIRPNPNKSKQVIKRALDIVEKNGDELLKFIKNGSPRKDAVRRPDLEYGFCYYYSKFLDGDELSERNDFNLKLLEQFNIIKEKIIIPDYIIKRNPGISPLAQQNLWDYFKKNESRIDEMIPVYPEDEDAVNEYTKLVARIGKTIADYPKSLNFSRSILLINWMSGKPLSYLIKKTFDSYKKKPEKYKKKTIPVVIREVMSDVETFVRFMFVRDSSCFIDILRFFLKENGKNDLIENIPQLTLWLEFGVSNKTHISLLSLGLRRNTVIALSEYITNSNMTKSEVLEWILNHNLDDFDFSPIFKKDIQNRIQNY